MSLMERLFEILESITEENRLSRINSVTVSIGEMRQVIPESFQFAFDSVKKNTIAESAELIMEFVPVRIRCEKCGGENLIRDNIYICPQCGSINTEVIQGDEILIKSIDAEDEK